MSALRGLQRYARPPRQQAEVSERCELCGVAIGEGHSHLVDLQHRALACVCRPCALLFLEPGAAQGRFKTVPDRVLVDGAAPSEAEWSALEIPVRLAFFFYSSTAARWLAFYPSPAGATECELPLEAWRGLRARYPLIAAAAPDVEALLAWGGRAPGRFEWFLVPIVDCYTLVGRVRRHWRGFDGGDDVRRELGSFFAHLRERSEPLARSVAAPDPRDLSSEGAP